MNRIDRGALAWGAVFCALGAAYLLQELGVWRVRAGVLVPILLIVAGAVLAVSAAFPADRETGRESGREEDAR